MMRATSSIWKALIADLVPSFRIIVRSVVEVPKDDYGVKVAVHRHYIKFQSCIQHGWLPFVHSVPTIYT